MRKIIFVLILYTLCFANNPDTLWYTDPNDLPNVGILKNTTYTLKILLIEFSDVFHDNKYTIENWNDLFFSKNKYATPTMLSPDGEAVYGSMRDYYSIMSNGNFDITGYILNKDNNNDGKPDWIALSNTKNYYNLHSVNTFLSDAKSAANSQRLDVSTNSTTKLCVIYAGHMYRTLGGLHPRAVGGIEYIMSEKFAFGDPYNQERSDATFSGIGVHCHEFGHLLGFPDTYSNNSYSTAFWDLMGTGNYNSKAHAPAPLNPYFRIKKGWISPQVVNQDNIYILNYSIRQPNIFKLISNSDPNSYFLIDVRSFNSKMNFNGTLIDDYNKFVPWNLINNSTDLPTCGLLVWAVKKYSYDPNWAYLIQADGMNNSNTPYNTDENDLDPNYITGDSGDPFTGFHNNFIFSPWSFPISITNNAAPTSYPIQNVGFEIIEVGNDYIVADLYVNNPVNASPQYPWFFNGSNQNDKITLNWYPNSEPDFNRYEIFRSYNSTSGFSNIKNIYNVNTTSYDDQNFQPSTSGYVYYKMRVKDNSSKYSVFTRVKDFDIPPNVPQNFHIVSVSYGVVEHPKLIWNANIENDLSGYKIERKINNGNWQVVHTASPSETYWTDMEISRQKSNNYDNAYYRMRAFDGSNHYSQYTATQTYWFSEGGGPMNDKGKFPVVALPKTEILFNNSPNPFNPTTTIKFGLPEDGNMQLNIYSINGQKVRTLLDGQVSKGYHQIVWDGTNESGHSVSGGLYVYELKTENKRLLKKMLLVK